MPEESRASGIAAAQTVVALARFVSSVGFGLMWQLAGRTEALWVMGGVLVVALVGATWFMRPMLTRPPRWTHDAGQSWWRSW